MVTPVLVNTLLNVGTPMGIALIVGRTRLHTVQVPSDTDTTYIFEYQVGVPGMQ